MLPLVNGCLRKVDASLPSVSTKSSTVHDVALEPPCSSVNVCKFVFTYAPIFLSLGSKSLQVHDGW